MRRRFRAPPRGRQRGSTGTAALLAILLGAGVSLALHYGASAWVASERPALEKLLADVTEAPARIGQVRLVWEGLEPTLELHDARLLMVESGTAPLRIGGMRLGVDWRSLLRGELSPRSLKIRGLSIRVNEDAEGHWRVGLRERRVRPELETILRLVARFDRIELAAIDVQMSAYGSNRRVSVFVQIANLATERGGWRVHVEALDSARSGRLTADGFVRGTAQDPARWRHSWQATFSGSHDFSASVGGLFPDWRGLPDMVGAQLRLDIQRQGRGSDGSWLVDMQARSRHLRMAHARSLDDLRVNGNLRIHGAGVQMTIPRLYANGRQQARGMQLTLSSDARTLALSAQTVDGAVISPLVRAMTQGAAPRLDGALTAVRATLERADSEPLWVLTGANARVDDLEANGTGYAIEGLSGKVSVTEGGGRFTVEQAPLIVRLPERLYTPLRFDQASGVLAWQRARQAPAGWRFDLTDLRLRMGSLEGAGGGSLALAPDEAPHLAVDVDVAADDVNDAKPFMPREWKAGLRDYLARAIDAGTVQDGRVRFEAPLQDGFWRDPDTEFAIDLAVDNARMRFQPRWPVISDIKAQVAITRDGLRIDAEHGTMAGMRMRDARVAIERFREAELTAAVAHEASLPAWYALLRETPLARNLRVLLDDTEPDGRARLDLNLTVPLRDPNAAVARGEVGLEGADLYVDTIGATVRDIRGTVFFANHAIAGEAIQAQVHGRPLTVDLDTEQGVQRLSAQTEVDVANRHGLAKFIPDWLQRHMEGVLPLRLRLDLRAVEGRNALTLQVGTEALALGLPVPLSLQPEKAREAIRINAQLAEGKVDSLALRWPGKLRLVQQSGLTHVHLGPGSGPEREAPGFHLSGHADRLALAGWLDHVRAMHQARTAAADADGAVGEDGRAGLASLELTVSRLLVGPFELPDLALQYGRAEAGDALTVDGSSRGSLRFGMDGRGRVEARMKRLKLRRHVDDGKDVSAGGTKDTAGEAPSSAHSGGDGAAAGWTPGQLPGLDLLVGEILFEDFDFGALDLRLEPREGGVALTKLRLSEGNVSASATGHWLAGAAADNGDLPAGMRLEAEFSTDAIDPLLTALGYARTLRADRFRAEASLQWDQMDALARLATAEGTLSVRASNGTLAAVEPGAGRMLGLFNFFALPRRFGLDFRDVTASGLAFDSMSGTFDLGDGNAVTDDLTLDGPSLRVEVDGRIGLAAQDYDQRIRIYPDVSGGMTIGGAVLGGPIGVGLALLARELFETPIDEATKLSYRLVGPWDDPQIVPESIATANEENSGQ